MRPQRHSFEQPFVCIRHALSSQHGLRGHVPAIRTPHIATQVAHAHRHDPIPVGKS